MSKRNPQINQIYLEPTTIIDSDSKPIILSLDYAPATTPELDPMSLAILRQAIEQLPEGDHVNPKAKIRGFKPPVGEAYGRIEGPKGELGFHLISDGSPADLRSFLNDEMAASTTLLIGSCRSS